MEGYYKGFEYFAATYSLTLVNIEVRSNGVKIYDIRVKNLEVAE